MKFLFSRIAVLSYIAIFSVIITLGGSQTSAISQMRNISNLEFRMPNRGAPGNRKDAGTRNVSSCPTEVHDLTALVPQTNLGLTISEYPTFWFYLPDSHELEISMEFILLDDAGNTVYQSVFEAPSSSRLMSLSLADEAVPLEINRKYQWYLSANCSQKPYSEANIRVRGWVERIELDPDLLSQLSELEKREQVVFLSENGLWHETVAALYGLRHEQPQNEDFLNAWVSLLGSIGLEEIGLQTVESESLELTYQVTNR
ncbi:protein of unknown function DUF928 [Leptolyngbya sp. PCC 7375]|nr:protein of unknown function DUF928 [Leptolyngbya sp. PCC 7375]